MKRNVIMRIASMTLSFCFVALSASSNAGCTQAQLPAEGSEHGTGAGELVLRAGCDTFMAYCAGCHGEGLEGDGPHGEHLDPPPKSLLAKATLNQSDEQLNAWILEGGGEGSKMPAFSKFISAGDSATIVEFIRAVGAGHKPLCEPDADDGEEDDDDDGSETENTEETADETAEMTSSSDVDGTGSDDDGDDDDDSTSTSGDDDDDDTTSSSVEESTDDTSGTESESTGTPSEESETGEHSTEGDTESSGSGDPSAECEAWCGCLLEFCAEIEDYPFDSLDACYSKCAATEASLLQCWSDFCSEIKEKPAEAPHLCDHAWGGLGDNECGP
jgi:mono/diheme cytochrome c family protein